jgi:hypothetical protein
MYILLFCICAVMGPAKGGEGCPKPAALHQWRGSRNSQVVDGVRIFWLLMRFMRLSFGRG